MAILDAPILPPLLYRYRNLKKFERELSAIENQELWFAHYRKLNDPMEGFYEPQRRLERQSDYAVSVRAIFDAKQAMGICCLSDTFNNELMWTHYADNYEGICVGYRTEQLLQGLSEDYHLVRLAYGHHVPEVTGMDASDPRTAARKILSHKKANWIYEREWRLLGNMRGARIMAKGCVREVRFGSRLSKSKRAKILRRLADKTLRIYEMTVSDYDHSWESIKELK